MMRYTIHMIICVCLLLHAQSLLAQCDKSADLDVLIRDIDGFAYPKLQAKVNGNNTISLTFDPGSRRYKGKLSQPAKAANVKLVVISKYYFFTVDLEPEMDNVLNQKCVIYTEMRATKAIIVTFNSLPRRIKITLANRNTVLTQDTTEFTHGFQIGDVVTVTVGLNEKDKGMSYDYPLSTDELLGLQERIITHNKTKIAEFVKNKLTNNGTRHAPTNGFLENDYLMSEINSRLKAVKFVSFSIK